MRRLLKWLAGLAGIAALARLLSRNKTPVPELSTGPEPAADPAEELRRRLDENRAGDAVELSPPAEPAELDERRARVHAQAQETIDAMREPAPDGGDDAVA